MSGKVLKNCQLSICNVPADCGKVTLSNFHGQQLDLYIFSLICSERQSLASRTGGGDVSGYCNSDPVSATRALGDRNSGCCRIALMEPRKGYGIDTALHA
jgi:hypothetical protein